MELLAVSAETQPGFSELFLNLQPKKKETKKDGKKEKEEDKSSPSREQVWREHSYRTVVFAAFIEERWGGGRIMIWENATLFLASFSFFHEVRCDDLYFESSILHMIFIFAEQVLILTNLIYANDATFQEIS